MLGLRDAGFRVPVLGQASQRSLSPQQILMTFVAGKAVKPPKP